jgi:TrpR family trp operon transcriptional repressor
MKFKLQVMSSKKQFNIGKKELISAFCQLDSPKQMEAFITDILTPQEFENVVERWQLVSLLLEGKTQREIRDQLGLGIATVTRGSRQLKYGNGAFKKIIQMVRGE